MPIRSLYLFFISILVNVLGVYATTLSFVGDTVFKSDETTALPAGSYVSIGYFNDGFDFGTIPSQTWSGLLATSYNEISGSSFVINPAGQGAGLGSASNILGESLYVWIFDTSDTPNVITEQEFGLYTGTSAEWIGKGDNQFTDFNTLSISDIDVARYGSIVDGGIALAPVPEPSTYALVIGLLTLSYSVFYRGRTKLESI